MFKKENPAKKCEAVLAEIRWIGIAGSLYFSFARAGCGSTVPPLPVLDAEPTFE